MGFDDYFFSEEFWSHVGGCSTELHGALVEVSDFPGESEITEPDFEVIIEQNVMGFDVPVNYATEVEVVDNFGDLDG